MRRRLLQRLTHSEPNLTNYKRFSSCCSPSLCALPSGWAKRACQGAKWAIADRFCAAVHHLPRRTPLRLRLCVFAHQRRPFLRHPCRHERRCWRFFRHCRSELGLRWRFFRQYCPFLGRVSGSDRHRCPFRMHRWPVERTGSAKSSDAVRPKRQGRHLAALEWGFEESGSAGRGRLGPALLGEAGGQVLAQAFQALVLAGHLQQGVTLQSQAHHVAAEGGLGVFGAFAQALQAG